MKNFAAPSWHCWTGGLVWAGQTFLPSTLNPEPGHSPSSKLRNSWWPATNASTSGYFSPYQTGWSFYHTHALPSTGLYGHCSPSTTITYAHWNFCMHIAGQIQGVPLNTKWFSKRLRFPFSSSVTSPSLPTEPCDVSTDSHHYKNPVTPGCPGLIIGTDLHVYCFECLGSWRPSPHWPEKPTTYHSLTSSISAGNIHLFAPWWYPPKWPWFTISNRQYLLLDLDFSLILTSPHCLFSPGYFCSPQASLPNPYQPHWLPHVAWWFTYDFSHCLSDCLHSHPSEHPSQNHNTVPLPW